MVGNRRLGDVRRQYGARAGVAGRLRERRERRAHERVDGLSCEHGQKFGSATATLNIRACRVLSSGRGEYDRSTLAAFNAQKDQVSVALGVAYLY